MTPLRPVRVAQNRVLEGLAGFYWLLFPVFVLQCIYYANYRGRARRAGWLIAVPLELLRPAQLARFLKNNGVPTFGWSWVDGKAYFHVPAHLRGRADYLISRSRQPIEG
jgi:hypothetical protein